MYAHPQLCVCYYHPQYVILTIYLHDEINHLALHLHPIHEINQPRELLKLINMFWYNKLQTSILQFLEHCVAKNIAAKFQGGDHFPALNSL